MKILIKDVLAVLQAAENEECKKTNMQPNCALTIQKTNISVDGKKIAAVGEVPESFIPDKTIDGRNRLAIPGLINAHTHSYMAFMRNSADDLPFMDWLFKRIDPIEQQMTDTDAYWGAMLAMVEMIKSGTTCFNDMHMNINMTARAAADAGLRALLSRGLVGTGSDAGGMRRLEEALKERDEWKDYDRINFLLGPHAPYTCDDEYMRIVSDTAKREHMGIHVHLAESESEIIGINEKYHMTPIEMAEQNGLFDVRCVAAHCIRLTENDRKILKDRGVSVVTCPASNMKLGNGFAGVPELIENGINVCLGTDGAASNNSLNMFREMNLLSLVHKGVKGTPVCVSAEESLRAGTINAAHALGLQKEIGSIEKDKKADIVLLDLKNPSLNPQNNLISALVYSANGSETDTVIIDGEIVMENKRILTVNETEVYENVNKIANRMGMR